MAFLAQPAFGLPAALAKSNGESVFCLVPCGLRITLAARGAGSFALLWDASGRLLPAILSSGLAWCALMCEQAHRGWIGELPRAAGVRWERAAGAGRAGGARCGDAAVLGDPRAAHYCGRVAPAHVAGAHGAPARQPGACAAREMRPNLPDHSCAGALPMRPGGASVAGRLDAPGLGLARLACWAS